MLTSASYYLGTSDVDKILSWTPNEFQALIKGAKLREVDVLDNLAMAAVFYRVANNKKKLNPKKDLFDAETARKRILSDESDEWKESKEYDLTYYNKAKEAMNSWALNLNKKE
ncbi:hypothetical protein BK128_09715 [Viridibacillus sp. FSL H7-0596]|uniref:hypothetical protein n=1 Tax=Viridibacillus sp. FSL H7-0596 TaxID=1928923 RepID=UPI00096FD158|nr:hypothetical protein [Viridibacillus sp. FSL H7-0596]OMC86931.1 hypothetical protein BK128_09715 [Viridibacillus sp. FSL H7-0596]